MRLYVRLMMIGGLLSARMVSQTGEREAGEEDLHALGSSALSKAIGGYISKDNNGRGADIENKPISVWWNLRECMVGRAAHTKPEFQA